MKLLDFPCEDVSGYTGDNCIERSGVTEAAISALEFIGGLGSIPTLSFAAAVPSMPPSAATESKAKPKKHFHRKTSNAISGVLQRRSRSLGHFAQLRGGHWV